MILLVFALFLALDISSASRTTAQRFTQSLACQNNQILRQACTPLSQETADKALDSCLLPSSDCISIDDLLLLLDGSKRWPKDLVSPASCIPAQNSAVVFKQS